MFSGCTNLETVNLEHLKTNNCYTMFSNCNSLRNYTHNASFDLSRCTSIGSMFSGTISLTFADLSNMIFDNDVYVNMDSLFSKAESNSPLNGTRYNNNLSSVTFNSTFKPSNMNSVFQGSVNIENADSLSAITDTSKCTSYSNMFHGCINLTNIDYLSGLTFESCNNIGGMLAWCASLSNYSPMLDWDLTVRKDKSTTRLEISELFYYNHSLTTPMAQQIINTLNWGAVNGGSVFCHCSGLTGSIDLANLSFYGASYNSDYKAYGAGNFNSCSGLTEIKNYSHLESNVGGNRVRNIVREFSNCTSLSALTNANIDYVNSAMFEGCHNIADWSFIPNNVPYYYPAQNASYDGWWFYGPFVNSNIDDNFISRISPFTFTNNADFNSLFYGCPNITTLPTFVDLNKVRVIYRLANLSERQKFSSLPFTGANIPKQGGVTNGLSYFPYMGVSEYTTFLNQLTDYSSEGTNQTTSRQIRIMTDLDDTIPELIDVCRAKHWLVSMVLASSGSTETEITDVLSALTDYSDEQNGDNTNNRTLILTYNYGENKDFRDTIINMMKAKHWNVSFDFTNYQ